MAESTSDRITRMGGAASRALAFGLVLAVVLVVAGVLAVVGVDTVEVVATVLVAAVFGAALFLGQLPGLVAAGLATAVYVALRRSDIESAGAANFALLVVARAAAYGVVAVAGARARRLIDDLTPDGGPVDDRGLRDARSGARAPVFVFDEDGRAEPVPVGAGASYEASRQAPPAAWDGPPPWQQGAPAGEAAAWEAEEGAWAPEPGLAPPTDWTSSPQFYAGSGPHQQVPAEAAYDLDPQSGGYAPVPDEPGYPDPRSGPYPSVPVEAGYGPGPRSGQYPPVPGEAGYGVDPRSGGYPAVPDPRSGQYPAADEAGYGVDPRSGQYPAAPDPRSGQYPAAGEAGYGVDPRSGGYPAVPDPRSGQYPAADEAWAREGEWAGPGDEGWAADDGRGYVPGAASATGLGLTPSGRWDRVADDVPPGHWAGPPPGAGGPAPGRADGAWAPAGPPPAPAAPGPPAIPAIDPETRLWSGRYLCDRLAAEQQAAAQHGDPFSLVLVQVPDGPLAALSYRRQVTLLRELGHQFVAGGAVDHLVHVPDQTQHWFAVVLPGADRHEAQQFERRLRDGVGGYLRSRGLLLNELESASLTSPDDDEAMGAIWEGLIARGDARSAPELAFDY
jgi:hypothetical protein